MASIASGIRALIIKTEEEAMEAARKLQEARTLLPGLYQALKMLASPDESDVREQMLIQAYQVRRRYAGEESRTDRILRILAEAGNKGLKPVEIARALDEDDSKAVRTMLVYAKRRGLVEEYNGLYYLTRAEKREEKVTEAA